MLPRGPVTHFSLRSTTAGRPRDFAPVAGSLATKSLSAPSPADACRPEAHPFFFSAFPPPHRLPLHSSHLLYPSGRLPVGPHRLEPFPLSLNFCSLSPHLVWSPIPDSAKTRPPQPVGACLGGCLLLPIPLPHPTPCHLALLVQLLVPG